MFKKTEKEFKFLVSAEQFQAVLSKCNAKYTFVKHKLQANYYYDTKDNALNKAKTTIRIRQQYSDMELQIKKHRGKKNGLATSDEYIGKIETLPVVLKIPDVHDSLNLKGVLITERRSYSFGENSIICFDGNTYLGVCDYEVEIEVDECDMDSAFEMIEDLGLNSKTNVSKSERFFERLEAMNNGQSNPSL